MSRRDVRNAFWGCSDGCGIEMTSIHGIWIWGMKNRSTHNDYRRLTDYYIFIKYHYKLEIMEQIVNFLYFWVIKNYSTLEIFLANPHHGELSLLHFPKNPKVLKQNSNKLQILHLYISISPTYGFHNLNYEDDNRSDNDKKINNLYSNISLCQS